MLPYFPGEFLVLLLPPLVDALGELHLYDCRGDLAVATAAGVVAAVVAPPARRRVVVHGQVAVGPVVLHCHGPGDSVGNPARCSSLVLTAHLAQGCHIAKVIRQFVSTSKGPFRLP